VELLVKLFVGLLLEPRQVAHAVDSTRHKLVGRAVILGQLGQECGLFIG